MKINPELKEYCVDFCSIFIYAKDEDEAYLKAKEFIDNREVEVDQILYERDAEEDEA